MTAKEADLDVSAVDCTPGELTLTWENSTYSVYSALWLRDNDPAHRDIRTGQRLSSVADLPPEPGLQAAERWPPGHLTLSWDDGETSVFALRWLSAYDRSLRSGPRPTRLPWMGQPATNFAWGDYAEWVENPAIREDWLYYVARDGLAFLRDVPVDEGEVSRVAALIGFAREPNYGGVFDVCSVAEENNLAYANLALPVHTGHPYRDPVPGFQLLHCLSTAGQGGEIIFVDGMATAERVRTGAPDAFSTLCQTPILYRFQNATVDLAAERTMLEMDAREQFRAIYYNDRSIAPLPLKGPLLKKFYAAYRLLADLLREPARAVIYRLQPGDLVIFDNTRILHGRTVFSFGANGEHGVRHLQGCYVDADGLYSSLAVLSRLRNSHDSIQH
jgi:alpha-ketoglutarate-dependent taurine dioxygenase